MTVPLTLVSVDLDDCDCYRAIYGLPARSQDPDPISTVALGRFLDLFERAGVVATFFVIGRTVVRDRRSGGAGEAALRRALRLGHELANHSYTHPYDLVRRTPDAMRRELAECDEVLRGLGADVRGFRAPGYTHDRALLEQVAAFGYRYDSSSLPSLPYYWARRLAIAGLARFGRRSRSFRGELAAFSGPREPFTTAEGLLELPISIGPAGVPLIGTTLLSSPGWLSAPLRAWARRVRYLHLELHGIDLMGRDDVPSELRAIPELRVSLAKRVERLSALLKARGPTTRLCDVSR